MATVEVPTKPGRVTLQGISWDAYERLLQDVGDSAVRLTYDRGQLEIQMSPLLPHEKSDRFLERLVYRLADKFNKAIESGGAVTHKREDLERGLEPDACYWIEHEPEMRGKMDLDLSSDPPPDLIIEVDIHSSSIDRIDIYRELGVPEIWWLTTAGLQFLILNSGGEYQRQTHSRSFPILESPLVESALKSIEKIGESAALRQLLEALPEG